MSLELCMGYRCAVDNDDEFGRNLLFLLGKKNILQLTVEPY